MLEAMACGTPVAAYPEAGPLDVVGLQGEGGVLHVDLRAASLAALRVSRDRARARALRFGWSAVCDQFLGHLVQARGGHGFFDLARQTAPAPGGTGRAECGPV
jgi:glycosyltransferase involved in cell wall biosynthesis